MIRRMLSCRDLTFAARDQYVSHLDSSLLLTMNPPCCIVRGLGPCFNGSTISNDGLCGLHKGLGIIKKISDVDERARLTATEDVDLRNPRFENEVSSIHAPVFVGDDSQVFDECNLWRLLEGDASIGTAFSCPTLCQ